MLRRPADIIRIIKLFNMSQVSRRRVPKEIENKIFETLLEAVSKVKSSKEVNSFLSDLLSPVEKIMIAKRLAIAALLSKGYDYETIKDLIKVSQSTIAKVSITMSINNGYNVVINKISRSENTREFWQEIERLLHRMSIAKDTFKPDDDLERIFGHKRKTLV